MLKSTRQHANAIPLLMYHKVGAACQSRSDWFLNVSTRSFERQLRLLARFDYTGITFEDACRGLYKGAALPRRPICVTFDDGYVCVAEYAARVLKQLGWAATIFAPTDYVGRSNIWEEGTGHPILP